MLKKIDGNNFIKAALVGYFIFLLLSCFLITPFRDTFYYWDWSRHLSLSYYDGPPLIAYVIKFFTLLFGDTFFALNFPALIGTALTSFFIYKITILLKDKETGWFAAALYFTAPFINQELLNKLTYDNPLNLFWVISLYYVIRYLSFQKTADIYKFAIAAGLMLLSQYDGIILLAALLVYFVSSKDRRVIFKNKHFYPAVLLIIALFSPVLVWNAEHDWVSFKYQLIIHRLGVIAYMNSATIYQSGAIQLSQHGMNIIRYLWDIALNFNIVLLAALVGFRKNEPSTGVSCLKWGSVFFVIFWASASAFSNIAANYSLPLFGMLSVAAAFCLNRYRPFSFFLIGLFLMIDAAATVSHFKGLPFNNRQNNYVLAEQANLLYQHNPMPVITPHYVAAEQIGFWLKARPQVYVLSCGLASNQYQFWQKNFMKELGQKQVKQAWFFDYMNEPDCIKPYFKRCTELPALSYKKSKLYVYQCVN